jgi:hypothetical protein
MWSLHVADSLTRGSILPLVRMAWRVDVTFVVARTAVTHALCGPQRRFTMPFDERRSMGKRACRWVVSLPPTNEHYL